MHSFVFDSTRYDLLINDVKSTINSLSNNELSSTYLNIFHCIDHTTLRDEDNVNSVVEFCQKAVDYCHNLASGTMASVCVYLEYASAAKKIVEPLGIKVAAVVGGFPTGQMPLRLKVEEVNYAIDNGADEVDFVINRGIFLGGDISNLANEVAAARQSCGNKTLKVILETGQLPSPELIYSASMTALLNGADFIKTSTGKCGVGATPEAAYAMLYAIADFQKNCKRKIGFKVSGGVSTIDAALLYYYMTIKILPDVDINNQIFRIGTSRLVPELSKKLTF